MLVLLAWSSGSCVHVHVLVQHVSYGHWPMGSLGIPVRMRSLWKSELNQDIAH